MFIGCGVEGTFENNVAEKYPDAHILCTDYEKVIDQVKELPDRQKNVEYIALDTMHLGAQNEFDLIFNFDSIASESHTENKNMLQNCREALTEKGFFIASFSNAFAWLDIALLEPHDDRLALIDQERSSIRKAISQDPGDPEVWRMYYTPLRLRHLLKETGFNLKKMEIFFCDSVYFTDTARDSYNIQDPDLPLYEHFVVATK